MSEQQLQFSIVTGFHNAYPEHRGMLIEINNSTNKGAYRKGMGLVKGASDLLFVSPKGYVFTFELKQVGARHDVKHLEAQLEWANKINKTSFGRSFFIFSKAQFDRIMHGILENCKEIYVEDSVASLAYIETLILTNKKTVKI